MNKLKVMAHSLNVRTEPRLTSDITGILKKDEIVNLISVSDDQYWYNIYNRRGLIGWASHKYFINYEKELEIPQNEHFPWMSVALGEMPFREIVEITDNPKIIEYMHSTNLPSPSNSKDENAWCSAFVNWCIEKAGYEGTDSSWARSWAHWGKEIRNPVRGCVAVFKRNCDSKDALKRCGHVGFYISGDEHSIDVLGAGRRNLVTIAKYPKEDLISYRIPLNFWNM